MLSIAAMWSASKAWRRPKSTRARPARPAPGSAPSSRRRAPSRRRAGRTAPPKPDRRSHSVRVNAPSSASRSKPRGSRPRRDRRRRGCACGELPRPRSPSRRWSWRRAARRGTGHSRDHADPGPAQPLVEALGVAAGHRVQHEQRLALRSRLCLGALHELRATPRLRAERWTRSFAISARCGWFGGSARITCTVPTSSAWRRRPEAAGGPARPRRPRLRTRPCVARARTGHVADRRPSGDAVHQDAGERIELLVDLGRAKTADLDLDLPPDITDP